VNIRIPAPVLAAIVILLIAVLLGAFTYGVIAQRYKVFPYAWIGRFESAIQLMFEQGSGQLAWYYRETDAQLQKARSTADYADTRLNLVTSMGSDDRILISVVDAAGATRNELQVDWFEIWADAQHLPASDLPRSRPGTHVHGIVMLPDGDVVFNFEQLGLVRMTPCGEVVWKLPYRTHHSVFLDEAGMLWVSGQITHLQPVEEYPNHTPPFREPTVLQVSPDGEILNEISVFELLVKNDQRSYLHLVTANNRNTKVSGDTLHLNDVDIFPEAMEEGVFRHGDIMISLRNVSTVLVFDPETLELRYLQTGIFTRQHDPDFIDGNTISVFDNNNIGPDTFGQQSRILIFSASGDDVDTWYEGTAEEPFYTDIMGKSQWLENNHLLVTDSRNGRGFELNAEREIVWEYRNIVAEGTVGLVQEVQRLPAEMTAIFSEPQAERCPAP
jgi:hypothetical protein